jgi:hypothetical protein
VAPASDQDVIWNQLYFSSLGIDLIELENTPTISTAMTAPTDTNNYPGKVREKYLKWISSNT